MTDNKIAGHLECPTIEQFQDRVVSWISHVPSITMWQKCRQHMFSKRVKKIRYLGNLNPIRWSPSLSHYNWELRFCTYKCTCTFLQNINCFYTTCTLQTLTEWTFWKCWRLWIVQGYRHPFYLVNDIIKVCEIDDLVQWKTLFQKWRMSFFIHDIIWI